MAKEGRIALVHNLHDEWLDTVMWTMNSVGGTCFYNRQYCGLFFLLSWNLWTCHLDYSENKACPFSHTSAKMLNCTLTTSWNKFSRENISVACSQVPDRFVRIMKTKERNIVEKIYCFYYFHCIFNMCLQKLFLYFTSINVVFSFY